MSRKGENIYKRKDGRWEGRYILSHNVHGKASYGYIYAATYREVKEKLIQAKANPSIAVRRKKYIPLNGCCYTYWLREWLTKKKSSVKESTFIRYRNIVDNHIIPELGNYPVEKISTALMEEFAQKKLHSGRLDTSGGIAPKTLSDILVIIKETFQYVQNHGIQVICDFSGISVKKSFREIRVLSTAEERALITVLTQDMDRFKLGVYICLFTGIRVGELCALQWKNISFADRTLCITQTMQRLQYEDCSATKKTRVIITEPKSQFSIRTIPLPDFLIKTLQPFASSPETFLLSGEYSKYVEPRTMQNRFKKYLTQGGITDANFHALRHTFATRCVEIGFEVKTLSEILGHSSVKITLDRYVHSSMDLKRSNMNRLLPLATADF